MNEVEWDHEELNATRINWLQQFVAVHGVF